MAKAMHCLVFFFTSFFMIHSVHGAEKKSWFSACNPAQIFRKHLQHQQELCVEKIPAFWKTGHHQHGSYDQFTVDRRAAVEAVSVGLLVRFLYCCGHFGTKLETIKSAILIPGAAKAALYWGGSFAVYQYRKAQHEHIDLEHELQKLAKQHEEDLKKQQSQSVTVVVSQDEK